MSRVLLASAAYHFLWGWVLMLFPAAIAAWLGVAEPHHLEFMQGVGAIGVVYAIGCAVASAAPLRHWPIVLVGLLGMIAFSIGFVSAALRGELPWGAAAPVVLNLAWCYPFSLILRAAADEFFDDGGPRREARDRMMLKHMTQQGYSLFELSQLRPTLVVFLRHAGCTFCREALSDIARERAEIEESGAQIAFVTMSEEPGAQKIFHSYGLGDAPRISDPDCELYRAFELRRGRWSEMFAPSVWKRALGAGLLRGHGVGALDGDSFRMPGVFLIHDGRVLRSFRHRSPADRPDYRALAACEECRPEIREEAASLVG